MLEADVVQDSRDDEVDEVVDRRGAVVEARREEQDGRARAAQRQHVLEMDRRQRRLAGADDELPLLLERDRRRAVDEVLHRAGGDRAERSHRARTDHVRVDLRRARGVRRLPVVRLVDRDAVAGAFREARERLVAREPRVAVQLRREHLDRGAGHRHADLAVGGAERMQQAPRVRRTGRTGDPEEDAHVVRLRRRSYLVPCDASRKAASFARLSSPRPANDGIGEPALTHAGHFRCAIWKAAPLFFAPSAVSSGAPAKPPPTPWYVWQLRQPETAKSRAPASAFALPEKPSFFPHDGTFATSSEPSDSFAVAPLYVRTPIEITTRIAATIATGRRSRRRSERISMNGIASSSTSSTVGRPIVPITTVFGHLKIRSR